MPRQQMMLRPPLMRHQRIRPRLPLIQTEPQWCHRLLLAIRLQRLQVNPLLRRLVIPPRIQLFRRRLIQRRILKSQTSKSEALCNRACCACTLPDAAPSPFIGS
jgi:hypothetical protein